MELRRLGRPGLALCALLAVAVQVARSTNGADRARGGWLDPPALAGDFLERGQMRDAMDSYQPSTGEQSRTLSAAGIYQHRSQAEQEARARELMADSEMEQDQVQQAAEQYRHKLQAGKEESPELGEGRESSGDGASGASVEAKRIRQAMHQYDQKQMNQQAQESEPDLGEGEEVVQHTEHTAANDLTARARSKAKARAAEAAKHQAADRAKQIAAKVKKLVSVQRNLEKKASMPHRGMVDLRESQDATEKITQAAKTTMQDSLVAQKMEAEAAQSTFQNLIEHEREEQRKAIEQEREKGSAMLASVKKTLREKQKTFLAQMAKAEEKAEAKLEHTLADTKIAQALETAVQRKLSKRVQELTTAGKQVVGGVTDSVNSLKRRVRRLRRSQERMKSEQSTMQQTLSSQAATHQGLGESYHNRHLEQELEEMRLMQRPPQIPQQDNSAHVENMLLKQQLKLAEQKNQLLEKASTGVMYQPQAPIKEYSGDSMHKFFQKQKQQRLLRQQIAKKEENLNMLKSQLRKVGTHSESRVPREEPQLQADLFLQLDEGESSTEGPVAAPLYMKHMDEAYEDIERLRSLAQQNSIEASSSDVEEP